MAEWRIWGPPLTVYALDPGQNPASHDYYLECLGARFPLGQMTYVPATGRYIFRVDPKAPIGDDVMQHLDLLTAEANTSLYRLRAYRSTCREAWLDVRGVRWGGPPKLDDPLYGPGYMLVLDEEGNVVAAQPYIPLIMPDTGTLEYPQLSEHFELDRIAPAPT